MHNEYYNRPFMSSWRRCAPAFVALLLLAADAFAQVGSASLVVRVATSDGQPAGAVVQVTPDAGQGLTRTATIASSSASAAFHLAPGRYLVRATLAAFAPAEQAIDLGDGDFVALELRLETSAASVPSVAGERDRATRSYQTTFGPRHLDTLPASRTVLSLLETAHPFMVTDRIDGGGIWTAERMVLGGQGTSARQVTFRLDGQDVTDPGGAGVSLFYSDLAALQSVVVQSASFDADVAGPGPIVSMTLPRPGSTWSGTAQFALSPESMQSEGGAIAPIAQLVSLTDGGVSAGGPLVDNRAALFASVRSTSVDRIERADDVRLESSVHALTAHTTFRAGSKGDARLLLSFSDATRPLAARARFADRDADESEQSVVVHAGWDRSGDGQSWSLGGAFQRASLDQAIPATAAGGAMERLRDGAPLALADAADDTRQRWDLHATLSPAVQHWFGRDHILTAGATVGGASQDLTSSAQPAFAELVNGQPARVWDVAYHGTPHRSAVSASLFASDRIVISDGLTLALGARGELDHGSAEGSSSRIEWFTISPTALARWRPVATGSLAITSSYGWYRHRLLLNNLAVGDPAAPSGSMYRWNDLDGNDAPSNAELTRVAAVGAGTAGSSIDGGLNRPTTREFRIGVEHSIGSWRWSITGLDRREDDLTAIVNTGVTAQDYTVSYVDDPGIDVEGRSGYAPLPIYDRQPASFGLDRYLLTNATGEPSRYQGVEIALSKDAGDHWYFRFGGTAYRAESVGANRGYRPDENDQGLLGEAYTNPNAETFARGRSFFDRAYVMKVLSAYTGPGPLRASVIARYQDGQPFARLVVAEGLNQGTEIIQAIPAWAAAVHLYRHRGRPGRVEVAAWRSALRVAGAGCVQPGEHGSRSGRGHRLRPVVSDGDRGPAAAGASSGRAVRLLNRLTRGHSGLG